MTTPTDNRTTLAEYYGMDLPVIDALGRITGLFSVRASAQYIVLPYGRSISVPAIAEALNCLYQAGQAAGPTSSAYDHLPDAPAGYEPPAPRAD